MGFFFSKPARYGAAISSEKFETTYASDFSYDDARSSITSSSESSSVSSLPDISETTDTRNDLFSNFNPVRYTIERAQLIIQQRYNKKSFNFICSVIQNPFELSTHKLRSILHDNPCKSIDEIEQKYLFSLNENKFTTEFNLEFSDQFNDEEILKSLNKFSIFIDIVCQRIANYALYYRELNQFKPSDAIYFNFEHFKIDGLERIIEQYKDRYETEEDSSSTLTHGFGV